MCNSKLTFQDFEELAVPVHSHVSPLYHFVAFGGEAGEFLNVRKKIERDGWSAHLTDALLEEAGDALFYLMNALKEEEISFEDAARRALAKLEDRRAKYGGSE